MSWWPILCSVAIYIAFAVLIGKMIAFAKWPRVVPAGAAGPGWGDPGWNDDDDAEAVRAASGGLDDDTEWQPQAHALRSLLSKAL